MVSLKDIAAKCGVSVATVSKALNNHTDIGEDTRERVIRTAREMGYVPNLAAKVLRTDKTKNIGVLFADDAGSGLTHDYFAYVLDSFKKTIEKRGYDLTFINTDKSHSGRFSYLNHCKSRKFDGVLIACINFDDPDVLELLKSNIPIVTVDHMVGQKMSVGTNNIEAVKSLVSYAINKGHKKIAFIHGENTMVTQNRLASYYRTLKEFGIEVPEEYVISGCYRNTISSYNATAKLLNLKNAPTCILYPDDLAAMGGIKAILERGLSVPDDISIMGFDGVENLRHLTPQLTTYTQDTKSIGRQAAESLLELIESPKTAIVQNIIVEGRFTEGGTVVTPKS